jgi:hypothetical protein
MGLGVVDQYLRRRQDQSCSQCHDQPNTGLLEVRKKSVRINGGYACMNNNWMRITGNMGDDVRRVLLFVSNKLHMLLDIILWFY